MSRGTKVERFIYQCVARGCEGCSVCRHVVYRSKLEALVAEQLDLNNIEYTYEDTNTKIKYVKPAINRSYLPDFLIRSKSGKHIYVEAKGIWDYNDRYKHLLIRQQHPEYDIRFVFQRAKQRIRKGSKTTYRDICEGHGRGIFKGVTWHYSDNGIIPREWFN